MSLLELLAGRSSAQITHWRARAATIGLLLVAMVPGALYVQVRRHAHDQPTHDADAIIVLGAGGGPSRPSATYRARLDHALDLYKRGLAPKIIVTERTPGAEGARRYLLISGVPTEDVLMENRSTTTWENLRFAREVMVERGWNSAIISSCGFHLYRATRMAAELGIDAQGAAAPGSLIEAKPAARTKMTWLEVRKLFAHAIYEPPWPAVEWWERFFDR